MSTLSLARRTKSSLAMIVAVFLLYGCGRGQTTYRRNATGYGMNQEAMAQGNTQTPSNPVNQSISWGQDSQRSSPLPVGPCAGLMDSTKDDIPENDGYCYRWLDPSGNISEQDRVLVLPRGGDGVVADTPIGEALGQWTDKGNVILEAGGLQIRCEGIDSLSSRAGVPVEVGLCQLVN